jgi:iron complex transport system ATP-binding protein
MTIHDLNLAAHYCNRLLLLDKGNLVSDNTVDQVLKPELLTKVFGLPCYRDDAQHYDVPRVYFYPATDIATDKQPTLKPSILHNNEGELS